MNFSQYRERVWGQWAYAKREAVRFCIKNRLIEIEKAHTGSSVPDDCVQVTRCFGRYFERQYEPETLTGNSGPMYYFSICGGETEKGIENDRQGS